MVRRGAYAKGIAKREEILTTALEVIAARGFRGASVKEIAEAVGLSQAGLLHYFDSKDELFTEVLRLRDERDVARPEASVGSGGADSLADLLRIVAHNAEVPGLVQLYSRLAIDAAEPAHPAHDFFRERFARLHTVFTEVLRAGQAAGTLRADFDPAHMSRILVAATDGLQTQFLLDPELDMAAELSVLVDDLRA